MNRIFKAADRAWDHVRGTVLIPAAGLGARIVPLSPGAETNAGRGPTGGAARTIAPRSSGVMTNPGLRGGQSVAASPARRNSCQRSGSNSSIRFAGWVLIRSSTSRR